MRSVPLSWLRTLSGRNRRAKDLTEFKLVANLPDEALLREDDIPWAIIEETPESGISRQSRQPHGGWEGLPPVPVLFILPILIALAAFALSE